MPKFTDITGNRYGKLTVVGLAERRRARIHWLCKCDCGNETIVAVDKLKSGHTTSCGCSKGRRIDHGFESLVGQRFGRLTVIRFIPEEERTVRQYNWWCKCDCGNEIKANSTKLKKGLQKSCGCLKREKQNDLGDMTRKYKCRDHRLFAVYCGMMQRCYDASGREWKNYGGRGIVVCEEWKNDFDVFAEWALNNGYKADAKRGECTIDRKNVDGNYEPNNCRWISNDEQQNNRRDCRMLEYNGEIHSMKEWSKILNVSYATICYHCSKKKRSIAEMIDIRGV